MCNTLEEVLKLTGGMGPDLVIETAGSEVTTRQAIQFCKKGGTIVLVGYSASGEATMGLVPFVSTFAMLAAGRALEQIRNSVGYPHLNVKIGMMENSCIY